MFRLKKKPVDRWLALFGIAIGIILYLLPAKTAVIVVGALILIFFLLHPIIWNFPWIEDSIRRRIAAVLALVGLLTLFGFFVWPIPEQASLMPSLVIDTVSPDFIACHFQIDNIGKIDVRNVRMTTSTENVLDIEKEPYMARRLPAGGKLYVSCTPLLFKPFHPTPSIITDLNYDVGTKSISSTYRFLVGRGMMYPKAVVPPEAWVDNEGPLIDEKLKKALTQFGAQEGTAFFVLPELRPDGKPNIVQLNTKNKRLLFDPISRMAFFDMKTSAGRSIIYSCINNAT